MPLKTLEHVPIGMLEGQTVKSVGVQNNDAFITFESGDSISIYTGVHVFLSQFLGITIADPIDVFRSIVGSTVVNVEANDGQLKISFSNSLTVFINADDLPFESYLLYLRGGSYAV